MANKYFRVEIEGLENIPNKGSRAAADRANHSGTLPWDGVMPAYGVTPAPSGRARDALAGRRLRVTTHRFSARSSTASGAGGARARENAQRLAGERKSSWPCSPEGPSRGIAKRWVGALQAAALWSWRLREARAGATGTPRHFPVAVVGAEETYPLLQPW